ncbi:MAG: hypothetical protein ABXS93_05725 [Sulfurimonas sp.]
MQSTGEDLPLDNNALTLIRSLIDQNGDLVFVFYNNKPILFNESAKTFFHVDDLQRFAKEFGSLEDRFVPHELYFNTSKVAEGQRWQEALMSLEESKRIVSIFDNDIKPHAFSVTINTPLEGYELVFFHDITTDLIKSLMIEHNTNLDEDSGAYNRNYFEHISPGFIDTALYNEKLIGLYLIDFGESDKETVSELASHIKKHIRDDDMLVRWNKTGFLLTCLLNSKEYALTIAEKTLESIKEIKSSPDVRIVATIKQDEELIKNAIKRCEEKLQDTTKSYLQI